MFSIKSKQLKMLLILYIIVWALSLGANSYAQGWQELKGEHFLLYFITGDVKFAQDVLDKAEVYYRRIATDLGYPRYAEFWLWDKRAKIYMYPDHKSYIEATGQPQWSQGMADYKNKMIASYIGSKGFIDSILPHEIAHLIFRDFVGFKGEIPLWLDEGVAQWAEEAKRTYIKNMVKEFYNKDSLLSINDMMKLDIRNIKDTKNVYIRPTVTKEKNPGVLLLSSESLIDTYYIQSVALVGFLIEKYGSENFATFCRQMRDGKLLEDALRFAYPEYIRNLNELEERWRQYLSEMK